MKTILLATNFSPAAFNAAIYAVDMAIAYNANLLLLHTYQLPVNYIEAPLTLNLEDLQQTTEKEMEGFKRQLIKKKGS